MSLKSLPDLFDPQTHHQLDNAVNAVASRLLPGSLTLPLEYVTLLGYIIRHSKGDLHAKYMEHEEAMTLIDAYGELKGILSSAWEKKSYRNIRNLAILKAPRAVPFEPMSTDSRKELYDQLSLSFKKEYRGAAVDGFYEYLTQNERLFRTANDPSDYAKFCSIVQSSGTGKSRVMTELIKKDVVVIYMNLREESDNLSFPLRDPIPCEILTRFPLTEDEYQRACYAFFTALFDTVEEYLTMSRKTKAGIMHWVRKMSDLSGSSRPNPVRTDFFNKVAEKYEKVHSVRPRSDTLNDSPKPDADATDVGTEDIDVDKAADRFKDLTLTANATSDHSGLTALLFTAYVKMAASLEEIFADNSDQPKLVIAVDEAHPAYSRKKSLSPCRRLLQSCERVFAPRKSCCLGRVCLDDFQGRGFFTAQSETFVIPFSHFSPFTSLSDNSNRISIQGAKLFPPYTQLGWDQSAFALGEIGAEDVSRLAHIAGYGRPLWVSLRVALTYPHSVLGTASSKLCGAGDFNESNTGHVLAVLGQRFGLNVTFGHPDSVEHLESGVASHLRMCLATTLDRNWRFTSYPSEPILSCAAARLLHRKSQTLGFALDTLMKSVNSGMIDIGQRGELASRLLWLLAKDLFVRKQTKVANEFPSTCESHLPDCKMILVVDWLEFVFGPQVWENTQGSLAREMFKDAYLNFSHWVCMETNIASAKGNELRLDVWTQRHWQRTSGVQCCHQQTLIDKMIPIYFKGRPESTSPQSRMSQILISDKARGSKSSKSALRAITRRNKDIGGQEESDSEEGSSSLPYIAILADLGQPSSFSVTFAQRDIDDRCLRIYAAGADTATYPFLGDHPALMKTLQDLVHIQQIPETETPFIHYLNAQVKFGSTASPEHMEWERGRTVPDRRKRNE